jgi:alanyl-tRNA synthetase
MRIIADHIRTATFILGDPKQIQPNNTGQGYVLRRLIRRAIGHGKKLGICDFTPEIAETFLPIYKDYPELKQNKSFILEQLKQEETKFNKTLEQGTRKIKQLVKDKKISGKNAFLLYQSYGFPIEMTQEMAEEYGSSVDIRAYQRELKKHQELSRTASSGQFKSGLQDNSEQTTKLHTATHLLNEALREVISKDISQRGSNINPERLRFDFNLDHKMSDEEKQKVEDWINARISEELEITKEEMSPEKALKQGAQGEFGAKYPDIVSAYTIQDKSGKIFSKEICTGPHVSNTKELGHFKILKEESSSAGIRRIKATVE